MFAVSPYPHLYPQFEVPQGHFRLTCSKPGRAQNWFSLIRSRGLDGRRQSTRAGRVRIDRGHPRTAPTRHYNGGWHRPRPQRAGCHHAEGRKVACEAGPEVSLYGYDEVSVVPEVIRPSNPECSALTLRWVPGSFMGCPAVRPGFRRWRPVGGLQTRSRPLPFQARLRVFRWGWRGIALGALGRRGKSAAGGWGRRPARWPTRPHGRHLRGKRRMRHYDIPSRIRAAKHREI